MGGRIFLPLLATLLFPLAGGCDSNASRVQASPADAPHHLIPPPPCDEQIPNRSSGNCDDTGGGSGGGTNPTPPPGIPSTANQFWWNHPNEWPYTYSNSISIGSHQYLGNLPSRLEADWTGGLQGLSHDEYNWYFSTRGDIYKWSVWDGVRASKPEGHLNVDRRSLPHPFGTTSEYDHFGDIDFCEEAGDGLLYIPMDAHKDNDNKHGALVVTDRQLNYIDAQILPNNLTSNGSGMPWVAVHPLNTSLIFSSVFGSRDNFIDRIDVYKDHDNSSSIDISFEGNFFLRSWGGSHPNDGIVGRVQGGEFSQDGKHLVLAAEAGIEGAGLYFFDMNTGILKKYIYVQKDSGQEIEGVTYWNLSSYGSDYTYGIEGNVHTTVYQDGPFLNRSEDMMWFKHYDVESLN